MGSFWGLPPASNCERLHCILLMPRPANVVTSCDRVFQPSCAALLLSSISVSKSPAGRSARKLIPTRPSAITDVFTLLMHSSPLGRARRPARLLPFPVHTRA